MKRGSGRSREHFAGYRKDRASISIVSDHGNEYTLQLQEISNDADVHFDFKVFIVPGDKTAKHRLADMPVFVPAAELEKAKHEAAAAKAAQAAELKTEESKAETYRRTIRAACTLTSPGMRRRARS